MFEVHKFCEYHKSSILHLATSLRITIALQIFTDFVTIPYQACCLCDMDKSIICYFKGAFNVSKLSPRYIMSHFYTVWTVVK